MSGFPRQPPGKKGKTLIIQDDPDEDDPDEGNPFSFKEFVKGKTSILPTGRNGEGDFSIETKHGTTVLPESRDKFSSNSKYQETFFKDPTVDNDLLDEDDYDEEEEDWSGSYHPSVVERLCMSAHLLTAYITSLPHTATSQGTISFRYGVCREVPLLLPMVTPIQSRPSHRRRTPHDTALFQSKQMSYEEVLEENNSLRRKIQEMHKVNESQSEKVKYFERELEKKILEEQKEAQDLESMVQQVEANLQMMTKRAAKAESHVTKLKQEVTLLQIQLNTYKAENEALRRGETAGMNAVKQNASLALENLHKAVSGAQTSIKQLVSGAEALTLVAELLRSIDKIAEVHDDGS
ncbi:LOW QUALITY PROTEIN: endosome-associated-trafficking regulator 1 [Bufo gargarizans]|uniref:LOW QUALITY PROTEIN: endosome-associated-trafficking regulator 1 n=1 Tax=Bufo gargarizans TaxID=30331 RepID=UPI001CF57437|nr:LOW QUALITY PROTEIN: endosome-associated-trafficking regulator 1 [Bufo gargarizans]